jgi:four helix bundle protein
MDVHDNISPNDPDRKYHRDLKERTMKFAVAGVTFYKGLPNTPEAQVLGKQFLRSATSVGANTRSAFRGRSKREFIAKLGIVVEEADECGYWLELMGAVAIVKPSDAASLLNEANELTAIFTSISKR